MGKTGRLFGLVVLGAFFWFLGATGAIAVTCGPGVLLQTAIDGASPGATISVSGTCNENVDVNKSVILDGGGVAIIHGQFSDQPTVKIRSGGVTIRNFHSIEGGQDGIYVLTVGPTILNNTIQNTGRDGIFVNAGTGPTINGNTIQNNGRHGIDLYAGSFATIITNTITGNTNDGIIVNENSAARIGFSGFSETIASPNVITNNHNRGIFVYQSSNAIIVGNTISGNTGPGVQVSKLSHADIADNTIEDNQEHGIYVSADSGVNLGNGSGLTIFDLPNNTNAGHFNLKWGISYAVGAYVSGRLGTLTGVYGDGDSSGIGITISSLSDVTDDFGVDVVTASNGAIRLGNSVANNTTKTAGMVLRHYSNAEEPVYLFGGTSTSTGNSLAFGGGSTSGNAATQLDFFTASNPTTPVGTSRMTIASNGNIGIGTPTPTRPLTLISPLAGALFQMTTTSPAGGAGFGFAVPTGGSWVFKATADNGFKIRDDTNAKDVIYFQYATGNVGIGTNAPAHALQVCGPGGCSYNDGGTAWINASSREYKDNIQTLGADVAIDALMNLNPVTFAYKTMPEQKHVGFVAEEVPDIVAMRDRKGLSPMDIVAVLTKVVQEQQNSLKALQATNEKLEQRLLTLEGKGRTGR